MTGEMSRSPVILRVRMKYDRCDGATIPFNQCSWEQRFLSIDAPIAITALPESLLIKVRLEVEYDRGDVHIIGHM